LGLGETYMDHWWDCDHLDDFFYRLLCADLPKKIKLNKRLTFQLLLSKLINLQTKSRSLEVGKKHYDLGNELFHSMLDSRMNYTCGYWKNADNLDDAQLAKLELTCQKLMIKPGMRILDIGCGFGAFAKYAAEKYQASVVGITISQEQYKYARDNCKNLPVEIRFEDYRDINEQFDRIVSLGMFESVGYLNYRTYMLDAHKCLKEEGLFLLHTIGDNISNTSANEWTTKYIFPNGMLPSITQIGKAAEDLFVMEDWHNFGVYYDKTLMSWYHNFNQHWDTLKLKYDDRFYRMWNYYLLSSAGAFRARHIQLWQIVLSKKGLKEGYIAPR
jgi:cyclopropane-fatty-acyl-phospholipid synthase